MDRPPCAELSRERAEPLAATASYVEHWILLEYRGLWPADLIGGSGLADQVKAHLRAQLAALRRSRLVFIRRPERRRRRDHALYFGRTSEHGPRFYGVAFEDYEEVRSVDFAATLSGAGNGAAAPVDHPLLVVCTHGKRDRCCATYGRPLYEEVREQVEPDWVWQATHVGGDRFAGNLVCLPEGVYFGRVALDEVAPLLREYLAGRIYLDRYRGRSCFPFAVQAAEKAVRERAGLTRFDDVSLMYFEHRESRWHVRFEARLSGDVHELVVDAEDGEATYLTCSAVALKHPRRFVATEHRIRRRRSRAEESPRERDA